MSDTEPSEIVIVRRRGGGGEEGHHGGVWKIAFADFMTAMMAFFLVLWIVNSTSKETRSSVARYFNPVKLAETSPARKGLQDPKEADFDATADLTPKKSEKPPEHAEKAEPAAPKAEPAPSKANEHSKPSPSESLAHDKASAGEIALQSGVARPKSASPTAISEAAAIEDPMSVLDEIAGHLEGPQIREVGEGLQVQAQPAPETRLTFKDPFEPISPTALPKKDLKPEGLRGSLPQPQQQAARPPEPASASEAVPPVPVTPGVSQAVQQQASRLRQALNTDIRQEGLGKEMPQVEITADPEGILISLTDSAAFAMFTSASSVPQGSTVKLLADIGKRLKDMKGSIVVRGHTDNRPFKAGASDNWRLSSARAQMAFYMLVRGGLEEKRIERVEGYADRRPKNGKNPGADENRRIEILVRPDAKP